MARNIRELNRKAKTRELFEEIIRILEDEVKYPKLVWGVYWDDEKECGCPAATLLVERRPKLPETFGAWYFGTASRLEAQGYPFSAVTAVLNVVDDHFEMNVDRKPGEYIESDDRKEITNKLRDELRDKWGVEL